jgi:SAM-dependent methyltransferase
MAHSTPNQVVFQTFHNVPAKEHASKWNQLWDTSVTPWDRGQASDALRDLLTQRADLVPPVAKGERRKKALVPGCGRGHDVLLLASLGYDTVGLDLSHGAINAAEENERAVVSNGSSDETRGKVRWVVGDFFEDGFLEEGGVQEFDLIFDYTASLAPVLLRVKLIVELPSSFSIPTVFRCLVSRS